MKSKENNFAFIDGNNVTMALRDLGWKLDHRRFRVYLQEHYHVDTAYYFIGLIPNNNALYKRLQAAGFILIFKPTIPDGDGRIKGNIDAELVLQAMIDLEAYHQAVIVSGDGDFSCLVRHLEEIGKLRTVLVPNGKRYSGLLKQSARSRLASIDVLRKKLEYHRK